MNFKINLMTIVVFFLVKLSRIEAQRLTNKANLRGVIAQFSSFSPREVQLLRKLIQIKEQQGYGRFR